MILSACLVVASCRTGARPSDAEFNGRWNITVPQESRSRAWWLEIEGAGTKQLKGRFVGAPGGGLYEIPEISIAGGELVFAFTRRYALPGEQAAYGQIPERRATYRARLEGGKLAGSFEVDGHPETRLAWFGERAPAIADKDDGTWKEDAPVELFNGRDLTGWQPLIPGKELGWSVQNGILTNADGANNLVSERKFWNFKLHAEYRLVPGSNSVTVVLNGIKVIDKGVIEGLTAMGHDPHEDQPGPISIQGDHRKVEIRKLVVTPLVKG
jgi:hypothetical protein